MARKIEGSVCVGSLMWCRGLGRLGEEERFVDGSCVKWNSKRMEYQ